MGRAQRISNAPCFSNHGDNDHDFKGVFVSFEYNRTGRGTQPGCRNSFERSVVQSVLVCRAECSGLLVSNESLFVVVARICL
jgi:hypothetical protein